MGGYLSKVNADRASAILTRARDAVIDLTLRFLGLELFLRKTQGYEVSTAENKARDAIIALTDQLSGEYIEFVDNNVAKCTIVQLMLNHNSR